MNNVLPISEAAEFLGVTPKTLRRWEDQGLISPLRTNGNQRSYLSSDLERFQPNFDQSPEQKPQSDEEIKLVLAKLDKLESKISGEITPTIQKLAQNLPSASSAVPSAAAEPLPPPPPVLPPTVSSAVREPTPNYRSRFPLGGVLLALLLLLLLGTGTFLYFFPAEFKKNVLNPSASFLLSGGARVEGTMRFLAYLYFGETDEWYITPLGDASFRNLKAGTITASSITTGSLTTNTLTAQTVEGAVSWNNVTDKPVILSSLDNVSNNEGNIDLIAQGGGITITPNDSNNTITFTVPPPPAFPQGSGSGNDADTLDGLDSSQFLRSDTSDSFTSGTLTFNSGTTLSLASGSTLTVAGTSSFSGPLSTGTILPLADDTYDLGSSTLRWRDLYLGPTSLHLVGTAAETTTARDWKIAIQETGGASEGNLRILEGTNELVNVTPGGNVGIGITDPTARLQLSTGTAGTVGGIIKGVSSQSADLLQFKNSLDSILARVDALGNIISTANVQGSTLTSTVATGTAPLTVASTTQVSNLNVSFLEGQTATALASQPQPNLILNSDFSRRNKWMTFMPETFTDTAGVTVETGGTNHSVSGNLLAPGTLPGTGDGRWKGSLGLPTWRDARYSTQIKWCASCGHTYLYQFQNDSNWVGTMTDGGTHRMTKKVGGSETQLQSDTITALTDGNYYWLELETQGVGTSAGKAIAKFYTCPVAATACAKAAASLTNTIAQSITDSGLVVGGKLAVGASSTSMRFGGLSTGDGGTYVEGWGPESWKAGFVGTLGGQAIGFDETADGGPLNSQWNLRVYIPAIDRRIRFTQFGGGNEPVSMVGNQNRISSSTAYTASMYMKVSGASGNGLIKGTFYYIEAQNPTGSTNGQVTDAGETAWTRKTVTTTTPSTAGQTTTQIDFNGDLNRTGTAFIQLVLHEQGSIATQWRNAPADDDPIVWLLQLDQASFGAKTNTTPAELESSRMAINAFLPWDANVKVEAMLYAQNNTADSNTSADLYVDGTIQVGGSYGTYMISHTTVNGSRELTPQMAASLAAGKHRLALATWMGSGSTNYYANPSGTKSVGAPMTVTATKGKFDLAEEYSVEDFSIEAGDVVRLSPSGGTTVEKVTGGYDQSVLGIISTAPGVTLSSQVELNSYQSKPNLRPVALSGRVPVKVTSENGPIKRGDFLTSSSSHPGYAMKATKAGRTIGVAMEDFGGDAGKIMVFVNLSWYDPQAYITDSGEYVISKVASSELLVANGGTEAKEAAVEGETPTTQDTQVTQEAASQAPLYELRSSTTNEIIERIGAYNSLFVANLNVGKLDVSDLTVGGKTLNEILANSGEGNGVFETITSTIEAIFEKITAKTAQIASAIIDKLTVKELTITGPAVGQAVIPAGESKVLISNSLITNNSRVFTSPLAPTGGRTLIVGEKVAGVSVEIYIESPLETDLTFDYWIVN